MANGALLFGEMVARKPGSQTPGMIACALLIVAVFTLDLLTPRDIALPFLYVLIVGTCLWWATSRQTIVVVVTISVLIVVGFFLSPEGRFRVGLVNDGIALLTLALLAYSGLSYRSAVDKVQQRERELTDFVENAAVGMYWIGLDGTILWANTEQLDLIGCNREEYVGHNIAKFHVDKPEIEDILGKLNANVALKDYEARFQRKDGSIRDVLISSDFRRTDSQIVHARCYTRDVTDRKRAERAERESYDVTAINARLKAEIAERNAIQAVLLEAEQQYRELVDSVRAIVWRADAQTFRFTFVSGQVETILGYPARRWLDEAGFWQAHIHPDDREWAVAFCVRATADLHSHDFEYRMIAADGHTVWLHDLVKVDVEAGRPKVLVGIMIDVTRRREAEERRRESEELLRVTFDTAPAGINIVNREGRFLKTNAAYQRMTGYTEEELRHKTPLELTHQDDLPRNRMLREEVLEGRRDFFEIEKRNHTKDGRLIWVRTKVSVVKDGLGKLRFMVGVAQDITEQRRAERILAESEERYRFLYETNPMPMWIARGETLQIVAVNDAAVQLYGYTRDEFDTMTSFHFQSEDTLAAYKDFVKGRQADLSTLHRRGRHRKKDGSIIDVDITSHPISYAGSPARLVLAQDITERLKADTALREQEELLRITFDAAPVGICIVDTERRFVRTNAAYQKLVGYTAEELHAQTTFDLNHPDDTPQNWALRKELLEGKRDFYDIEKRYRTKNGDWVWVRNRVSLVKDESGKPRFTVAVVQDITERKRAEEALRESEARFRQVLDNVDEIIYVVQLHSDDPFRGRVNFVSGRVSQILGHRPEEFLADQELWISLVHPGDMAALQAQTNAMVQSGEPQTRDYRLRTRETGEYRWIEDRTLPQKDASGKVTNIFGVARDITERKHAEETLRKNYELLDRIFATTHFCVVYLDRDLNFVRVNKAYADTCGHPPEFFPGKNHFVLYPGKEVEAIFRQVMATGEPFTVYANPFEFPDHPERGVTYWDWTLHPLKSKGGDVEGLLFALLDVTERKRAEETLRESEDRYRDLVEHSQDLICTHDLDGRILSVNPWAAKVLGYEPDELPNMNLRDILASGVRHEFDDYLATIRANGVAKGLMLVQPRTGKKRVWKYNNTLRTEGVSTPIVRGTAHDITEQLRAERALRERTAQLRMSEVLARMASLQWDIEADHLTWSRSPEWLLGPRPASGSYPVFKDMVHPQDRQRFLESRQAALEGLEDHWVDFRIIRTDGGVRSIAARGRVRRNSAGRAVRMLGVLQDITDRKRAEEAQAWLAAIVEHATVAIFTRTLDGTILSWNAGAERMLGYTAAEAIGKPAAFTLPPGRPPNLARNNEKLLRGEVVAHESDRMTKDGRVIDVLTSHSPVRDGAGNIVGASVILQDITERVRAERELERQAALSRLLESLAAAANKADTPQQALAVCLERICAYGGWNVGNVRQIARHGEAWRATGTQWYFTDARDHERFSDFTTLSSERLLANPGAIFINQIIRTRSARWISNLDQIRRGPRLTCVRKTGVRAAFAFPVIVHDEVVACVEFFATEVLEPDAALLEATGDIASHLARVIEREMSGKVQAQLAAIVETSPDAILSRALDDTVLSWNQGAERMFGYSAAEVVGKYTPIIPEDRMAETQRNREFVNAGNTLSNFETERIARDGRRIQVAISAAPIVDLAGKVSGVATITRDITERKQAERELARKTALAQLLEGLARTVNEAGSPEAAMQVCLARICEHGGWTIGRLGIYGEQADDAVFPERSFWHTAETSRYEEFMRASLDSRFYAPQGKFISVVLREKRPVWFSPISSVSGFGRMAIAIKQGLHCAFAFPVVVRDKTVAVLEFFAEEARPADLLVLENITSIAGQLARLVERDRAANANARLAAIVQTSNDAIIGRAPDGTITSWNAAAERILGYTADEVVGSDLRTIFPPESMQQIVEDRKLLGMGVSLPYHEAVRIAKDGRRIDVAVSTSPIKDESGRAIGTAAILRDITERKGIEEERTRYFNRLRALSRRLVEIQETERRRLAAELHDRIGQNLTALTINLNIVSSQLSPRSAKRHAARLEDSRQLVEATIETMRNVISELRPTVLDDYGLRAALRWYGSQFEKRSGVLTTVEGEDLFPRPRSEVEAALYRIAQEALNNTLKHAQARCATLRLDADAARVTLTVADDGVGFDLASVEQHGKHPGWGLLMMRERAESVGGRIKVESALAHGTRVVVEVDKRP